jgi:hypothetical protein
MSFIVQGLHGRYNVREDIVSKGGVGAIHRTDDPDIVYKEYLSPSKAPSREDLERLVVVGRKVLIHQGLKPGDTPESSVNWPVDLHLAADRAVVGVLLPTIPRTLFNRFGDVRGLEFLVLRRGEPPPAVGRVALLIRMAEILAYLQDCGLVHGDVNGKNLAWSLTPQPTMYLIDCDGMVPQSPPPTTGVQAAGWTDPRLLDRRIPAHDHYSDWYALALAIYRGLMLVPGRLDTKNKHGDWPRPSQILPSVPRNVRDLLDQALSDPLDVAHRPSPRAWVDGLIRAFVKDTQFDHAVLRRIDDDIAKRDPAQKSAPTTFTQLPQVDWNSQQRIPTPTPVPTAPTPGHPTPPYQRVPPAPPKPTYQPPRPRPTYVPPPPTYPPAPLFESARPIGGLADRALLGGFAWYVKGILSTFLIPAIAMIYTGIALRQMRRVSPDEHGVTRARISLWVFFVLSAFFTLAPALSWLGS